MNQERFRPLFVAPRTRWIFIAIGLVIAAVLGWRLIDQSTPVVAGIPKTPPGVFQPTNEQWVNLKVAEVKLTSFRSVLSTDGAIAFNDDAMTQVYSPYSGRVTKLLAKLGDVVRKGGPLLVVEASEFVQARNDLAVTRANLDTVRATEKRQHELFQAGAGAEKDWRQAQSDLAAAEAAYAAACGRLRILGKSDAEIDSLAKAPAGHNVETIVAAPISGTVTQRQIGVGQYIASATSGAANPVYTIGDLTSVWLVANVRETDAPRLQTGQTAEVTVLALPGEVFRGKVSWIGASVDPVTHRLPVRIEVKNSGGLLKPQMFASFSIATSGEVMAPAVPENAAIYDGNIVRVYVANDDGTVVARTIRAGRTVSGMIEVLDGLKEGERIVTAGTLFIDRAAIGD